MTHRCGFVECCSDLVDFDPVNQPAISDEKKNNNAKLSKTCGRETPKRSSPALEQAASLSTPHGDSPRKSPSSAKRLKSFFQDLQRESRHALTNKRAKIAQLWEGRRWRRASLEEVEPFAEMEERELSSYGATEPKEYNSNHEENDSNHQGMSEGQRKFRLVENRC